MAAVSQTAEGVELCADVFAALAAALRNLRLEAHCGPASLPDWAGGVLEIEEAACGG